MRSSMGLACLLVVSMVALARTGVSYAADDIDEEMLFHETKAELSILNNAQQGSHRWFVPKDSTSFALVPRSHKVNVTFLDHTMFKGYDGSDFVQVGQYSILTRLCFITETEGHSLFNVDGIVGFGLVEFKRSPSLLETMSQRRRKDWNITQPGKILEKRQFAFIATDTSAEVQLGGYDPASIVGDMFFTERFGSPYSYSIKMLSVSLGGKKILDFTPNNNSIPALLDTGTSCITLPSTKMNDSFVSTPYDDFVAASNSMSGQPALSFNIDGTEFELPYEAWHQNGCVEPSKRDLILGDPFFRYFVVLFDMVQKPYKFGIAKRNTDYKLVSELHPDQPYMLTKQALERYHPNRKTGILKPKHAQTSQLVAGYQKSTDEVVSRVPSDNVNDLQYLLDMAVGTPPQKMKVIFDTGSYMLAIYSKDPTKQQKERAARGELLSVNEYFAHDHRSSFESFISNSFSAPFLASAFMVFALGFTLLSRIRSRRSPLALDARELPGNYGTRT